MQQVQVADRARWRAAWRRCWCSGESGTGKELVARAIHAVQRTRADGAVHRGQLRRHSRDAARGRVLRLPQGRVHRRRRGPRRLLPGGAAAARCSSTRSATCRWRCRPSCCARSRSARCGRSARCSEDAGRRAHRQRHAQGPGRRGAGRPLPAGPVLPPERDPDPRAAAARAPRGPAARSASAARRASRSDAGVCRRRSCRREALQQLSRLRLPRQRARAREPAAPRAWRCRRRGHRRAPISACPTTRSSTAASSTLDALPRQRGRRARSRRRRRRRGDRCRATWWPTSTSWSATSWSRALEQHRFNRTAAGASLGLSLRQMRYRMARLGVNVGRSRRRRPMATELVTEARGAAWRDGWWRARAPHRVAQFGARPAGTDGRRWSWCIRSACRRASTAATRSSACSPTGWTGTRIRTSSRSRGLEVSAHFFVRRDGELLQFVSCDAARLACRRVAAGAGATTATTTRSASSSRASKASASSAPQYEALAALLRALARRYPIARRGRPRAHRAGPQARSRRGLRLGAAARARCAGRAARVPFAPSATTRTARAIRPQGQ